jgi:Spy/CpxP family protein refolding chaperone
MNRLLSALTATAAVTLAVAGFTTADIAHGTATPALAQAAPDAPAAGHGNRRFGQMLLSLNLSDAQKSQIRGIMATARQKNAGVTDPQLKRATMRAAYAQVRAALTPAQRSKLDADVAAARAARAGGDHS